MEKGKGPPLPPRILIQLDRLSNVQFSQLTRKQLKDQVDELKQALIEEFAKLKPVSERPQVTAANDSTNPTDRPRSIDLSSKTATSTQHKDIPKMNSSADKKPIPTKPSNEKRDPEKEVNKKTAAKSSVPSKPSYADLLKMAESVRKESSPVRASSREKFENSVEDNRRNGSHGSKSITSNHRPSSPSRSRSNEVPRREPDRDKKMNVPKPDSRGGKSSVRSNQDSRNQESRSYQESKSHRDPRSNQQRTSNTSDAKCATNNRAVEEKSQNGKDTSQPKKGRERKKSKKEEEEEILERKRQKIREENERVKVRNEVLAGKRSASDLKNVVKQISHGNTVLSCRPASSTPSRRDDNFGRPLVQRTEEERQRRPPVNRREYLDDYDEEDEDMDSFIDDDEGREEEDETPDVSKAIRDIFGYDKRKYIGMDEDIEEASYSQIMKEEARSQRIGRQEDLADMREELKQKRLKRERLKRLSSR